MSPEAVQSAVELLFLALGTGLGLGLVAVLVT